MSELIKIVDVDPEKIKQGLNDADLKSQHDEAYKKIKKLYIKEVLIPMIAGVVLLIAFNIVTKHFGLDGFIRVIGSFGIFGLSSFIISKRLPKIIKKVPEFERFMAGKSEPENIKLHKFLVDKKIIRVNYKEKYIAEYKLRIPDTITCTDLNGETHIFGFDEEEWMYFPTDENIVTVFIGSATMYCPDISEQEENITND